MPELANLGETASSYHGHLVHAWPGLAWPGLVGGGMACGMVRYGSWWTEEFVCSFRHRRRWMAETVDRPTAAPTPRAFRQLLSVPYVASGPDRIAAGQLTLRSHSSLHSVYFLHACRQQMNKLHNPPTNHPSPSRWRCCRPRAPIHSSARWCQLQHQQIYHLPPAILPSVCKKRYVPYLLFGSQHGPIPPPLVPGPSPSVRSSYTRTDTISHVSEPKMAKSCRARLDYM
ncbi:hypothetical protein IWX90DRAFT_60270 [Phyllosticta citrichinensis]|uniref:Uncharacterized protein n=1 Tax=Phyllosticta citrichinensis TaxID=1130410 RepID=A0ABR1XH52_9PEZI